MVTPYISQQPVDDFGLRFSDLKFSVTLDPATDTLLTIPGNAQRYKALIKTDGVPVWVSINSIAAPPSGSSFASSTSEMLSFIGDTCREVRAGDILHFYQTDGGADVSVVLYALGTNN